MSEFNSKALALLEELVAIQSGTENVDGVRKVQQLLASRFESLQLHTRLLETEGRGPILLAENGCTAPIILLAHADTVYNNTAPSQLRIDGDRVYGPGALDLKGGIVTIYLALEMLSEEQRRTIPLRVLINSAEEFPNEAVKDAVNCCTSDAGAVLCIEFGRSGGVLVVSRLGRLTGCFRARGNGGHAANVDSWIDNPLVALSAVALQLKELAGKFPECQLSIGYLQGGNPSSLNVIPREAELQFEARVTAEAEHSLVESFHQIASDTPGLTYHTLWQTKPRDSTAQTMALYEEIAAISADLGMECCPVHSVPGLSDINFVDDAIPAVDALGPYGENAHRFEQEWVCLSSLEACTRRLYQILVRLGE
jgi:glutamate carboxypeptidase